MLSSIHPLGERAKGNSFFVTAAAFVVGAVAGGATTGAAAGVAGLALRWMSPDAALWTVVAVTAGAIVFEWSGRALPSLRRQVNEDWLHQFRGWVYGAGFGFQLGAGVLTYITSAAVPVVVFAALLAGSVPAAVAIGAAFGLGRGLSIIPARRIDSADRLVTFHRSLQRTAPAVRGAAIVVLSVTAALAALRAL